MVDGDSYNELYCIKRDMFFAVNHEIIKEHLLEEEANELCTELNKEEVNDTYVYYYVEKETCDKCIHACKKTFTETGEYGSCTEFSHKIRS